MSSKSDQLQEHSPGSNPKDNNASNEPSNDSQSSPSESKGGGWDEKKIIHNVSVALDVLKQISELDDMIFPLGTVFDMLKVVVDMPEGILKSEDDQKNLIDKLREQLEFIQDNPHVFADTRFRPSRSAVQGLVRSLELYTLKLGELQEVLKISAKKDEREVESCTSELTKASLLTMDSVSSFITDQTAELLARQALNQLQYVDGAQGNQHVTCLEGTRKLLLDEITQWASQRDGKPVFALIDQAGTGKSTISASVTLKWEEEHSLLCRFFFSKPKGIISGENVASTLAMDIAISIPSVRGSITKVLEDNPTISGYSIEKKLELLVFTPLKALSDEKKDALTEVRAEIERKAYTEVADLERWHECIQGKKAIDDLKKAYMDALGTEKEGKEEQYTKELEGACTAYLKALEAALDKTPIITLDALDECSKSDRTKILQSFYQSIASFPDGTIPFKLYFTHPPEEDVVQLLKDCLLTQRASFSLYSEDAPSNQQDIELYVKSRLMDKLDPQEISRFVGKANGLFIWVSTASSFIADASDPTTIFNDLMTSTLEEHPLDILYGKILDDACQRVGKNKLKQLLGVVQLVSVARRPLTVNEIDDLLGVTTKRGSSVSGAFVTALSSVISDGSNGRPVRALHPTFIEYLLRNQDSSRFAILNTDPYLYITQRCLAILLSPQLRHNMCGVIEPGVIAPKNAAIEELDQKIQAGVPPGLLYAARYGMLHTADCLKHEDILKQLRLFFEQKALSWIELMSYFGEMLLITQSISLLRSRLRDIGSGVNDSVAKEDGEWCYELWRMIQPFESVIADFAQQVYYSALAYAPREGKIFRHYYDSFKDLIPRILHGSLPLRPESIDLFGHDATITCLAFSPNGHQVASASEKGEVRLWDAETGAAIGTPLEGHTESVVCLSFSSDSLRLVSGSNDKTLRLWDVENATAIGEPLSGHTDAITCVSFSPDNRKPRIISGSKDGTLRLWDGETGSSSGGPLSNHTAGVLCVSFSSDGRIIASGSEDCTLRLWNGETGEVIGEHLSGHTGPITCLSFLPDGHQICSGSQDMTLRIWDVERGVSIGDALSGHTAAVTCLSISRDGKIVSGSQDTMLRLWDGATGAAIGEPISGGGLGVMSLSFSPDGRRIASSSSLLSVQLFDTETRQPIGDYLTRHVEAVTCLAFSPDGRTVASGSKARVLRLCDVETIISQQIPDSLINDLSFSPDGHRIASCSADGTMILRDGKTGEAIGDTLTKHTNGVSYLKFSPDSRKLATGGADGTVTFWDAENRTALSEALPGQNAYPVPLLFSADGRLLASLGWYSVRLWDVASATVFGEPLGGPKDIRVIITIFSPDSLKIALVLGDNTVRLWDTKTGTAIGESFSGHTGKINGASFSPDGSRIATASDDGTVRQWNAETGEAIGEPLEGTGFGGFDSVEFSVDGLLIAAATPFATVQVWNAETGTPIGEPVECSGMRVSLHFRRENEAMLLIVDNSQVLKVSTDPPNLQRVDSNPKGLIEIQDRWTTLNSKAPIQFCLPSQFHLAQSVTCGGIIAYAEDRSAIIIVDCTHLL